MSEEYKFDFVEEEDNQKLIFTIAGDKGTGKTTSAMLLRKENDSMLAVSFDHKTTVIKNNMYDKNPKIKVFSGVKYLDRSPDRILPTAKKSYEYIVQLISKFKPSWILIDGLEVMNNICEMTMRNDRGYKPYQGVSNMNDWKYRNDMMAQLHSLCLTQAKKGVIYTTYTKVEELIHDGVVIERKEIPKWFGNVLQETDITFITNLGEDNEGNPQFQVKVDNSKYDKIFKSKKHYIVSVDKGEFLEK